MAGQTIAAIVYGIREKVTTDVYTHTAVECVRIFVEAALPGQFLVDFIPIIRHIPTWTPGANFQKLAVHSRTLVRKLLEEPFTEMKRNIQEGSCPPCFGSALLQELESGGFKDKALDEGLIRDTCGSLVGAASETTVSAISSCILGLLQNPSVVIRAQTELDRIIPPGHLPDFTHESQLPFITAIVYETLRWRDVIPLGIPHKCSQDNVYKGYHIPAGTVVMANMWAMLHNATVYPEPFDFKPDRFMNGSVLDEDIPNPAQACWGFGRRTCPGRHMAFSSIWLAIASMIFCFDFTKARDENGNIIEPLDELSFGLTCVPKPYKSRLIPRSEAVAALILSAAEKVELKEE